MLHVPAHSPLYESNVGESQRRIAAQVFGPRPASNPLMTSADPVADRVFAGSPRDHLHDARAIVSGFVSTARLGSGTADGTTFLRGDQTWAVPAVGASFDAIANAVFMSASRAHTHNALDLVWGTLSAARLPAFTGDVTTPVGSVVTTIANDAVTTVKILNSAVTLAKIANAAAASKLLGSSNVGGGLPYVEITLGTGLSMSGSTLNASAAVNSFSTIDCPAGTDPVADSSTDTLQLLAGSTKLSITGDATADSVTFDVVEANINHDALLNFVADEHIDHATVSILTPSGSGLSGGGTIVASRTLQVVVDGATLEIATNTIQVKDLGISTAKIAADAVTLAKVANAAASSKLLGSGSSGAGADYVEISLGASLSMSGTTLNVSSDSDQTVLPGRVYSVRGQAPSPTLVKHIVQTADPLVPAAQALGALGTGILKNTTSTGVLSIAVAGTDYQAADPELEALAGLVSAADKLPYFTGSGTAALTDLTSFARTLLNDGSASVARSTLGLVIGADVQAWDADLDDLAGLTAATGDLIYGAGAGNWAKLSVGLSARLLQSDGTIPAYVAVSGDASLAVGGALTLTSVITAGGPTGGINIVPVVTWDAKGRLTAVSTALQIPPVAPASPTLVKHILQTAHPLFPAAQSLGALATGLVKNATTTGVLSIGVAGTDYIAPGSDHGLLGGLGDDDHTQYLLASGTRDLTGSMLVTSANELRFRATTNRVFSPSADTLRVEGNVTSELGKPSSTDPILLGHASTVIDCTPRFSAGVNLGTSSLPFAQATVDNLRLDGNTLSSLDANGAVTLDPNGTGTVNLSAQGIIVGTAANPQISQVTAGTLRFTTGSGYRISDYTNEREIFFSGVQYKDTSTTTQAGALGALKSYALPADSMKDDEESVTVFNAGTFQDEVSSKQITASFAGTTVFDSGTQSVGTGTWSWELVAEIVRVSSSAAKVFCRFSTNSTVFPTVTSYTSVTGLNWANSQTFQVNGANSTQEYIKVTSDPEA